jgi:arsenite/tail-anchored protein-transporting ATPase
VRIVLFTGKGGVGKTTAAAATALRFADRGLKTLLISTDGAHSIGDALATQLGDTPQEVSPGFAALQIDTQRQFSASWQDIQRYLRRLLADSGTDPITSDELTVLPGIDEVLALLTVREHALSGNWDIIVVDCAPTAETLRLLALPEALGWYLNRVFPVHRHLARGMRPLSTLLGRGAVLPPDGVFEAVLRLTDDLAAVRSVLADAELTSVRLVMTPESVVIAEARRTLTALALYGYSVDGILVNRVIPDEPGASQWQRRQVAAQSAQLAIVAESFAGLPTRQLRYLDGEPVGLAQLRSVADSIYGPLPGADPAEGADAKPIIAVNPAGDDAFVLTMRLPFADRGAVDASRAGDDLVVTIAGHRRVFTLPSVLRRCSVTGGSVVDGVLSVRFVPDPRYWRAP